MDAILHEAWVLFVGIGSWFVNRLRSKLADLDNYANAVRELLKTEWFKDFSPSVDIVSFGWDNDNYFFIVSSKEF